MAEAQPNSVNEPANPKPRMQVREHWGYVPPTKNEHLDAEDIAPTLPSNKEGETMNTWRLEGSRI